jgi:hypothetical protein
LLLGEIHQFKFPVAGGRSASNRAAHVSSVHEDLEIVPTFANLSGIPDAETKATTHDRCGLEDHSHRCNVAETLLCDELRWTTTFLLEAPAHGRNLEPPEEDFVEDGYNSWMCSHQNGASTQSAFKVSRSIHSQAGSRVSLRSARSIRRQFGYFHIVRHPQ